MALKFEEWRNGDNHGRDLNVSSDPAYWGGGKRASDGREGPGGKPGSSRNCSGVKRGPGGGNWSRTEKGVKY